jgi:hypothetical protein
MLYRETLQREVRSALLWRQRGAVDNEADPFQPLGGLAKGDGIGDQSGVHVLLLETTKRKASDCSDSTIAQQEENACQAPGSARVKSGTERHGRGQQSFRAFCW